MPRIKLDIPDKLLGSFKVPVRITDVNYGNHVGNDAFVSIIHEARMQWLKQYDYTEVNIETIGVIMSDLVVEFRNEAFYGDEVTVKLSVGEISRVGFELFYQLETSRKTDTILLAHAKTGMICYDYAAKKVAAIPEQLKRILTG